MNVADTEVVRAVLQGSGYTVADTFDAADVVLLNTCAIRENAEAKIWGRLRQMRAAKRKPTGKAAAAIRKPPANKKDRILNVNVGILVRRCRLT